MIRIVIADDESLIRMGLRSMLEERGYRVVGEASDGRRAVELVRKLRPDLVILDIKMPELDGLEAARQIQGIQPTPVVMLTAYSERELVRRAQAAGVLGYLVKPIKEEDLVPTIEVALARFRDLREREGRIAELEQTLQDRKLVERAKGILMRREGLTEEEAYRRIQQEARRTRRPMRAVAEEILTRIGSDQQDLS
ncbi:MAG: response regulator [Armatimonadota bacterium]|nr:response regulator [Armatimonadota bacterium]MDR7444475.1 response regulator [Armatimonadota bacterium]MDR7570177.1 response regulator [Armatimonadota bacterium]MDR7615220.1 response regulator [Armatimonadota bacterium]